MPEGEAEQAVDNLSQEIELFLQIRESSFTDRLNLRKCVSATRADVSALARRADLGEVIATLRGKRNLAACGALDDYEEGWVDAMKEAIQILEAHMSTDETPSPSDGHGEALPQADPVQDAGR